MKGSILMMRLKDFLNAYDGYIPADDFDFILMWSRINHNEKDLICMISKLAEQMAMDKEINENRAREWASYAMQLVPEINEDTDFTICINAVRLCYLAYQGKQFIDNIDKILVSNNIDLEHIKSLHPYIYQYYMEQINVV